MRRLALIILLPVTLALPGCLAKTVVDVATLPVKAVGKGVDMATTSQSEADEKPNHPWVCLAKIRRATRRSGRMA